MKVCLFASEFIFMDIGLSQSNDLFCMKTDIGFLNHGHEHVLVVA